MSKVVALCGTGAASAVKFLRSSSFKIIRLSDPVFMGTKHIFNFTSKQMRANEPVKLCDNIYVNPQKAMEFIRTDVFQYNIHHFVPGFGRAFWVKIAINKILKQQGNYCVADLTRLHDYYELKKHFENMYVIEVIDPNQSPISIEYIPYDTSIMKREIRHLSHILNDRFE
jgi:hypothetical protein